MAQVADSFLLKLKVSEKQKNANSKQWYKDVGNYYIPAHNNVKVEDYDEMLKLYQFMKNDLSGFKAELDALCTPMIDLGEVADEILPYNKVSNKLEILKGELLKRANNHKIVLLTAKAVREKNEKFVEKIKESVNNELVIEIQKVQLELQGKSQEEIQKFIDELRQEIAPKDIRIKDFLSEQEILKNKLLQYTYYDQDIPSKKLETLEDVSTVSRIFIYPGWRNGKPDINVCNPLHIGFNKSPNTPFIENSDYVWYRDEITISEALTEYINRLSKEDVKKLVSYGNKSQPNNKYSDITSGAKPLYDHSDYYAMLETLGHNVDEGIGTHQGTSLTTYSKTDTIWRIHLEFKAYKEVMFYTYTDDYNEAITVMLDGKTDIIPSTATKEKFVNKFGDESHKYVWVDEFDKYHEAEILWVPRRYELTRLGNDIYVDMREVPFQPDNVENPFSRFELTYKGGIFNSRNAKSLSIVQKALPYQWQLLIAKAIQNRELAKYQGYERYVDVDQIPDELAEDEEGNPIEGQDKLVRSDILARKTSTRYYSGSRSTDEGLHVPHTRTAGVSGQIVGTSAEILNFQRLAQLIDVEIGMAMGISPQREAMISPNTNVTDNKQSIVQSSLSTETLFYFVNKVWAHALNEHLINLDTFVRQVFAANPNQKEHYFDYILPDGSKELLSITPKMLNHNDIGLYLFDSGQDRVYFDFMTNQGIFAAAQNGGEGIETISAALKAIVSGASVEEVHKMIKVAADEQRQRAEGLKAQEEQMLQQNRKSQEELLKYQSDLKIEEAIAIAAVNKEKEKEIAEIESQRFALQADIDGNKVNDRLQAVEKQTKSAEKIAKENNKTKLEIAKINKKATEKAKAKN